MTQKTVLLLESDGQVDNGARAHLEALNFRVSQTNDRETALGLVAQQPVWPLVIINEEVGHQFGISLLETIKADFPAIPILWLASGSLSMGRFRDHAPDFILEYPLDLSLFSDFVNDQFEQPLCPMALADALAIGAQNAVRQVLGIELAMEKLYVKANRGLTWDINVLLPFVGPGICGHVFISGKREPMARLFAPYNPNADVLSTIDMQDMAAELANLVAGRLKEQLLRFGYAIELSVPFYLESKNFQLKYLDAQLNCVIWGKALSSDFLVESCIKRLDMAHYEESPGLEALEFPESGELRFFK